MKNKKNKNTLHRLFKFAGSCKGLLLSSVIFLPFLAQGLKSFRILKFHTLLFKYVPAITV